MTNGVQTRVNRRNQGQGRWTRDHCSEIDEDRLAMVTECRLLRPFFQIDFPVIHTSPCAFLYIPLLCSPELLFSRIAPLVPRVRVVFWEFDDCSVGWLPAFSSARFPSPCHLPASLLPAVLDAYPDQRSRSLGEFDDRSVGWLLAFSSARFPSPCHLPASLLPAVLDAYPDQRSRSLGEFDDRSVGWLLAFSSARFPSSCHLPSSLLPAVLDVLQINAAGASLLPAVLDAYPDQTRRSRINPH
jgi:hypothetical protein